MLENGLMCRLCMYSWVFSSWVLQSKNIHVRLSGDIMCVHDNLSCHGLVRAFAMHFNSDSFVAKVKTYIQVETPAGRNHQRG